MADFETIAFDSKAAAEARKKEMEEITEKLDAGVKAVYEGEGYKKYLNVCAKLPRYSVNNQILIMMQNPDATMCQSFEKWKEMGRFVKRGEKGIRVIAPDPYKIERQQDKLDATGKPILDKDGETVKEVVEIKVNAFKPVSTFDISQTEGESVPTISVIDLIGSTDLYDTLTKAIQEAIGVPVTFEQIKSGAKGYYVVEDNRIAIQEGMSEEQTLKTLLHGVGHAALHSREMRDRNGKNKSEDQKVCEAESIAYVVCQHYGIDTSEYSFDHVGGWSEGKEVPELKASLGTIRRAASEMIMKIDETVAALVKDQDITKTDDIEAWHAAHETEIPFDDGLGDRPAGYAEVTLALDEDNLKPDMSHESTKDAEAEKCENQPDAKDKPEQKDDRTKEHKREVKERASVKKQLAAGKEKAAKEVRSKKEVTKSIGEAI